MRKWKNQLYFGAMPGRYQSIEEWLSEMKANAITRVVCLAPPKEIQLRSPAYRLWRQHQTEYEVTDVPIPDYGVPDEGGTESFWRAAARVAQDIENGWRVFIHCGAGIGRTGTFASAVLVSAGYEPTIAIREITVIGSYPETPRQESLVKALRNFDDSANVEPS